MHSTLQQSIGAYHLVKSMKLLVVKHFLVYNTSPKNNLSRRKINVKKLFQIDLAVDKDPYEAITASKSGV